MTDTLIGQENQPADTTTGATAQTDALPGAGEPQAAPATDTGGKPAAGDPQPADGQQAQGDKPQGEQDGKPQGAPEQYDFKAPEGQQFDAGVIGAFSEVAKELNLPQDAAQKVLDKMAPVIAARQTEQLQALRTGWADAARTDKEFGGDKLDTSLATAKKALDTYGSPEFKKMLGDTGLGNNPEVIRFMVRVGKATSDDTFVGGKGVPAGGQKSAPEILYDKTVR